MKNTLLQNANYILPFFVGMMDGDGSIQVNHWRKQILQFRIIIKLKYSVHNENMLTIFSQYVGGNVRFSEKTNEILWVENNKKKIIKILQIFEKYPPFTLRINLQIEFLKKYIFTPTYTNTFPNEKIYTLSTENFFENFVLMRQNKYNFNEKQNTSEKNKVEIVNKKYFHAWLSGFIEAEACFSVTKNLNNHFSIGQKNDEFLIKAIIYYFNILNPIRKLKNNFFIVEVYNKKVLLKIISHIEKNPLLGEKKISYEKLKYNLQNKCIDKNNS